MVNAMPWPALRQELAIFGSERMHDGQPSWTLHDPVRNQFFRIDWATFEIVCRWDTGDSAAIAQSVSAETPLSVRSDDVAAVGQFLAENQLVQIAAGGQARALATRLQALRGTWATWLLHHYLFFRVPLARPDAWLQRFLPWVEPLWSRGFLFLTVMALVFGVFQIARDWGRFSNTLLDTFSWSGLAGYGVALTAAKLLHELGHAFTAKRWGCHVPAMGVALLVLFPVAYTDTNEVWKLGNRQKRLAVAGAGILTELTIAAWASLAWGLLPEGQLKSAAFMLATTTWVATLVINASPFMRFDGYFLLSDWLDLPNLHARSFALARWDLRERLFALGVPPPEVFSPARRVGLIAFAYVTWIYRLIVFLGIAALVYAFFIKAVGIILFAVEIGWFVVFPLWSEVRLWPALLRQHNKSAGWAGAFWGNARARRSLMWSLAAIFVFMLPWPNRQSGVGLLRPVDTFVIYAPAGAKVLSVRHINGEQVAAGETLLEFESPDLRVRLTRAQLRLARTRAQVDQAGVSAEQRSNIPVLEQERETASAEVNTLLAELQLYRPTAPFSGVMRDVPQDLHTGSWVAAKERLGMLVKPDEWQVEVYIDEEAVQHIGVGDGAIFSADGHEGPTLALTVSAIDREAIHELPIAMLAAQAGGSVLTRNKQNQLIPERATYKVLLQVNNSLGNLAEQSWRGTVVIRGSWQAPVMRYIRTGLALFWRELGF